MLDVPLCIGRYPDNAFTTLIHNVNHLKGNWLSIIYNETPRSKLRELNPIFNQDYLLFSDT